VEGAKTPAGGRDREDPAGTAEEASGPPAESEAPGTEINRLFNQKKTVDSPGFIRVCQQSETSLQGGLFETISIKICRLHYELYAVQFSCSFVIKFE
jgi:hypothetical protein